MKSITCRFRKDNILKWGKNGKNQAKQGAATRPHAPRPPGACGTALQHSAGKEGPGDGAFCRQEKRRLESEARAAGRGKALCPAAGHSARHRACACAVAPGLCFCASVCVSYPAAVLYVDALCAPVLLRLASTSSPLSVLLTRRCPVWAYPLSACTEVGLPRPASSRLHGCSYMPGMVQCREKGAGGAVCFAAGRNGGLKVRRGRQGEKALCPVAAHMLCRGRALRRARRALRRRAVFVILNTLHARGTKRAAERAGPCPERARRAAARKKGETL